MTGLKIAVAGGTGLVGGHATEALQQAGDAAVVIARSRGVDALSGKGLDEALRGVDVIVRATQFFEFADMVVDWTRQGQAATILPLLVQPIAARDAAGALLDAAHATPANGIIDVAAPNARISSTWHDARLRRKAIGGPG